jgi:hypothetical protein
MGPYRTIFSVATPHALSLNIPFTESQPSDMFYTFQGIGLKNGLKQPG